jgi:hypothetical protein
MPFKVIEQAPGGTFRKIDDTTDPGDMMVSGNMMAIPEAVGLAFGATPGQTRRAVGQGVSLGFSDEIAGGIAAGVTAVKKAVTGRGSAAEAYRATVQHERDAQAAFHGSHPILDTADQVAGGLATPGVGEGAGFIAGARSLGGAALRAGAVGAAYGTLAGAGNAEGGLIPRAVGAGQGAVAGGLIGAAAPIAARAALIPARAAGSAISETASRIGAAARGPRAPVTASPSQLASARTRALAYVDQMLTSSGRSLDDLRANPAQAMNKPITAAEAIGRTGQYQLQTLGKRAGTTADALEGTLDTRAIDAPNRQLQDVSGTLGVHPDAARGNIDTIVEQGQAKAGPLFDEIRDRSGPVWNDTFAGLAKRPVIQRALKAVASDALNAGENPEALGIHVTGMLPDGSPDFVEVRAPTAATWDAVKKALSRQVERHPITNRPLPDTVSEGNYGVSRASKALTGAMREHIPGYAGALDASGDYMSARDAFDRTKGALFRTNLTAGDFNKMWAGLTESQREAAKASIANDIFNLHQNGRLRPKVFQTPSVRAKLATAFGDQRATDLIARIEQESILARGQRMKPGTNSTTGETAYTGEEQDNGMGLMALRAGGRALIGDAHGAARDLGRGLMEAVMTPVRGASTPINEAARNEVGRLLMMSPSELAAELEAYRATPVRRGRVNGRVAPVAASAGAGYIQRSQ